MDRFDAMRVFTRVVERRSFTLAAEDLGLPRSTVTDAVKALEARLGVRLLERTTRQVRPTLDGEAYHQRCLSLIADVEEAEAAFGGAKPKGLLRVDVHGTLARHFVMPRLPDFLAEYPGIELYMSEGDRLVDLIREGIDCVLRVGDIKDSDMIARRVAMLDEITCAGPAYIDRFGQPASVDALGGHIMVGFHSSAAGTLLPLEFVVDGAVAVTPISYTPTDLGTRELSLYDLTGRHVRTVAKGGYTAGPHDVGWDGLDQSGHVAGPGVYLARLEGTRTHVSQHIVLVR